MKLQFDLNLWFSSTRTAGALLIGNSVLVYTEVIGAGLKNATSTAGLIFTIGLISTLLSSGTIKGE